MSINFDIAENLKDECPLWIYTANRKLGEEDQKFLLDHFNSFSRSWQSHGREVDSSISIVDDRFLVLAADVRQGDISGCGIDASVRQLTKLAQSRDIEWVSAMNIVFRSDQGLSLVDRMEFRLLAEKGVVNSDTTVFDTSINKVGQWRAGQFSIPVADSWHAKLLPQKA